MKNHAQKYAHVFVHVHGKDFKSRTKAIITGFKPVFLCAQHEHFILPLKIQRIPIQFNHMCQIINLFKIKKTPQRLFFIPDFLLIF